MEQKISRAEFETRKEVGLTSLEVAIVSLHPSIPAFLLIGVFPNSGLVTRALNEENDDENGVYYQLEGPKHPKNNHMPWPRC